jgi:hypothetical protein
MTGASTTKVTVTPSEFTFVKFDASEIETIVTELAGLLEVANPIRVVIDETTPLAKLYETLEGLSSDAVITLHAESGALEASDVVQLHGSTGVARSRAAAGE